MKVRILNHESSRRGFTLIEAMLAATILAIAIIAIIMPFTAAAQQESEDARKTTAVNLAQEMMEEILSKPFYDPQGNSNAGPENGENTRSSYDNIDDYDGYSEAEGNIKDANGVPAADPSAVGLSRSVSADYLYVQGQSHSGDETFIEVTVEIRYRGHLILTLSRLVYANG